MKIKRKILAIGIVALFIAISLSHAEASGTSQTVENEPYILEFGSIGSDGTFTTEAISISEEDLEDFETAVAMFMDNIIATNNFDWSFLRDLLEKILGDENSFIGRILGIFTALRMARNRGYVVSSGHGRDFNPLKKFTFKIRKRLAVWTYNSNGIFADRTIIFKPRGLQLKILKGRQFGMMTGFFGMYFSISRGFLSNSYTFFFGTAKHINGFDFTPNG